MGKIVYSHRVQQLLKQSVVELGLTVTMTDGNGSISLTSNEKVFRDAAQSLGIDCVLLNDGNSRTLEFRRR